MKGSVHFHKMELDVSNDIPLPQILSFSIYIFVAVYVFLKIFDSIQRSEYEKQENISSLM